MSSQYQNHILYTPRHPNSYFSEEEWERIQVGQLAWIGIALNFLGFELPDRLEDHECYTAKVDESVFTKEEWKAIQIAKIKKWLKTHRKAKQKLTLKPFMGY